jgi:hypothetical protein
MVAYDDENYRGAQRCILEPDLLSLPDVIVVSGGVLNGLRTPILPAVWAIKG